MKKSINKIGNVGIMVLLVCLLVCTAADTAYAAENNNLEDMEKVTAQVVVPEKDVFSAVTYAAANGVVVGTGVRLRKKPSSSATILELMYDGEFVDIYYNSSTAKWFFVNRLKTGTRGYVHKQYVFAF